MQKKVRENFSFEARHKKNAPAACSAGHDSRSARAWIVAVDMGYGHQRAAFPLQYLAHDGIINANSYDGIPKKDKSIWETGRRWYERISRMKHIPFFGDLAFGAMDAVQKIDDFYPKRDLSRPKLQTRQLYGMIKKGWGRHLIEKLNQTPLPLITTFFTPAFFAEEHGFKKEIYVVTTDADISRAWAPLYPRKSRIRYLATNTRVRERLMLYGVKPNNIFLTGFPLPLENIGRYEDEILRADLGARLCNLDPQGVYHKKYYKTLSHELGMQYCPVKSRRKLTITFAVGGAGAQREHGVAIAKSLKHFIRDGKIRLNLVAGTKKEVKDFFETALAELGLKKFQPHSVNILYDTEKLSYFSRFNKLLHETDILWTKPSELVFYSALGLPIIMSEPIGSQEMFNREWLQSLGSGISELDARYCHEWLFDWLNSGWIAEAAMNGFLDAPHMGTRNIEHAVFSGKHCDITEISLW